MISSQNTCTKIVILPQSVGTTEVTGTFDCLGYDQASVIFVLDSAEASSVITTASLGEGDASNSFTAITTFEGGDTTDGYTLPVPATTAGDLIKYEVDCKKRKRYLQVGFASTTARLSSVIAILSRPEIGVSTDTLAGCDIVVEG
jgi:hypothetical protein